MSQKKVDELKPSRSKFISENAPGNTRVEKGKPIPSGVPEDDGKEYTGHSDKMRQWDDVQ